jgi:hypothetical protein
LLQHAQIRLPNKFEGLNNQSSLCTGFVPSVQVTKNTINATSEYIFRHIFDKYSKPLKGNGHPITGHEEPRGGAEV